ncbi:MAG: tetratricopeptide repeat protein [Planctomycetota bacterium]
MDNDSEEHPGFDLYSKELYSDALPLIIAASDSGDTRARCTLGQAYLSGKGVQQDVVKAADCFKSSAEGGYSGGQYWYGRCRESGKGTELDLTDALDWYFKAAEQGNPLAEYRAVYIFNAQPSWKKWLLRIGISFNLSPAKNQWDWPEGI